jgi:hypothetical protein
VEDNRLKGKDENKREKEKTEKKYNMISLTT